MQVGERKAKRASVADESAIQKNESPKDFFESPIHLTASLFSKTSEAGCLFVQLQSLNLSIAPLCNIV